MSGEIGYATLGIIPSFDGFESKLNSGTAGAMSKAGIAGGTRFGDAAGNQAGHRFGRAFKTAAKASLVGLGVLGVGAAKLAADSVKAASDLEESTNKVSQVFGKGADDVFRFSSKAADALGQTNQQARDAAATFGIFGNAAGLSDKKNAKFAKRMTKLASDLASFSNTSPDEAIDALGSALRGESEPIRKYGVLLDEATLKAEALRLGLLKPVKDQAKIKAYQARILEGQQNYNEAVAEFGPKSIEAIKAQATLGTAQAGLQKATEGTIPQLTQQQKVLAAQSSIFKQTGVAQGDFARTSDGLANQQRRLSARFEDAKAKLGKGLLPIMTDAADFLLDKGIPAFERFSDWFTKTGAPAIGDFSDKLKPLVAKALPKMADALGAAKDALEGAAPFAKDIVKAFQGLPDGVKKGLLVGGGLYAANKLLRGNGGGRNNYGGGNFTVVGATKDALKSKVGGMIADKLLAKFSKPLPVFVVNQGIGVGGAAAGAAGGKFSKAMSVASKAAVPVAIVAASAVALKAFYDWNHRGDKNPVGAGLGGGKVGAASRNFFDPNGAADFKAAELEKAAAAYKGINDATKKLPNQLDQGKTAAQSLLSEILKIGKSDPKVTYRAPGFDELFAKTHKYSSVLDGLDGRTVTTIMETRYVKNDMGEGGGGVVPGRSGDNWTINNYGADLPKIRRDAEHAKRTAAVGGHDFRG